MDLKIFQHSQQSKQSRRLSSLLKMAPQKFLAFKPAGLYVMDGVMTHSRAKERKSVCSTLLLYSLELNVVEKRPQARNGCCIWNKNECSGLAQKSCICLATKKLFFLVLLFKWLEFATLIESR